MYVKNYEIWLTRFEDRSKNMRWPRFFWTTLYTASNLNENTMQSANYWGTRVCGDIDA